MQTLLIILSAPASILASGACRAPSTTITLMISYHRASKKALERWAAFLAAERVSVTHAGHPRPLSSQEKPGDSAPKHWTEAPVTEKHWLDRRLPGRSSQESLHANNIQPVQHVPG